MLSEWNVPAFHALPQCEKCGLAPCRVRRSLLAKAAAEPLRMAGECSGACGTCEKCGLEEGQDDRQQRIRCDAVPARNSPDAQHLVAFWFVDHWNYALSR